MNHIAVKLTMMIFTMFFYIVPHSFANLAQQQRNFAIQQLLDPPPERIVYTLTHRQPKASSQESIAVFNQYLYSELERLEGFVIRE